LGFWNKGSLPILKIKIIVLKIIEIFIDRADKCHFDPFSLTTLLF